MAHCKFCGGNYAYVRCVMSDKKFVRLIAVICAVGVITSAALVVYTVQLYKNASIISYISKEEVPYEEAS